MKKRYLAIVLATLALFGCTQRPMLNEGEESLPKYYAYNPKDTIRNYPFLEMLRIDSARVEYLMERPYGLPPSDMMEDMGVGGDSMGYKEGDESVFDTAEAKWYELMWLCSQKQYEELLSMYTKDETDIGIALATSTNKFELDYFVIGKLLFEQLEDEEAVEMLAKFLEYDKLLTESVVAFSTAGGGSGYIPPQYAFQLEILCRTYLILEDREKAEALIEPYRKAIYLLSDNVLWNENMIAKFKTNIYEEFGDLDGVIETAACYRDFLIQYAKDTDQDFDEEIRLVDSLVEMWGNE